MRWKDLPIRKRLLAANYLMILTPILCFMLFSVGIFWIFGMENMNRSSVLSFIWPESGPTLSIQFELTRLRVRADHYNPRKPRPLLLVSDHLEDQGLRVMLARNGVPFYVTENQDPEEIRRTAEAETPEGRGDLDTPVRADSRDEIGDTLRAFEKARTELKAARERRIQYDQSRKELLAGIAHDLATPLTKIQGYASGIKDGIADTPEKRQRYLDKILETVESMARLDQTLFLFSKLDLDQVPFHWETVDLCQYVTDYVEEQQDHWNRNGLSVTFHSDLPRACIQLDRDQFARILENLLSNSWKYRRSHTGSVVLSLAPGRPGFVELRCSDDGQGVAPAHLDKIFESFYRTDRARSHVAAGSGLGLAVVRKIVETMDGTIRALPNEPQGLIIAMEFPWKENVDAKNLDH
ncbi:HAMP domain-containing sensor histidine kinase [Acidaminococcus timonensis]|uniref:sensor histidine kinase n=1 Tax=Acidaminococcus timonensis TaxID=1871002 RepID=UPI00307F4737